PAGQDGRTYRPRRIHRARGTDGTGRSAARYRWVSRTQGISAAPAAALLADNPSIVPGCSARGARGRTGERLRERKGHSRCDPPRTSLPVLAQGPPDG